jgi:hypothetical protein
MVRLTLIALALSTASLYAKSGNSTISGTVKDASEAVVPDARIKIVNVDTGVKSETTSNADGLYRVSSLVPGSYRLEADAAGFDHLTRGPIVVQVSQTVALDLIVQVGQQSASVNVVDSAPVTTRSLPAWGRR